MKFLLFALVFFASQSWAAGSPIEQAHQLYDAGKKDQALALYLEAAAKGDAEGHFHAAYHYTLPNDENTNHFVEAAKQGHAKALEYALDKLFFRANSLTKADPEKALAIYHQAKQKNPDLKIYDEEKKYETLEKCVEADPFDIKTFQEKLEKLKEQGLVLDGHNKIMRLAELIANTNLFGKPDARLALQVVCRSGWAPAELEYAVGGLHQIWRTGGKPEFNLCEVVTSRSGLAFCRIRKENNEYEAIKAFGYKKVKDHPWQIDGKSVLPFCLQSEWASTDNYDAYEEKYPDLKGFHKYPGQHWVKNIPLEPVMASWGSEVALPQKYSSCNTLPDGYESYAENNFMSVEDTKKEFHHPEEQNTYRLLLRWGEDICEKLLPTFKGQCHSLVYVNRNEDTNYSQSYDTFAHVTYQGDQYILPVTNNVKLDELVKMIDTAEDFGLSSLLKNSSLAYLKPELHKAVLIDLEIAFDERTKNVGLEMSSSQEKALLMAMYFKRSDSITDELLELIKKGKKAEAYYYMKDTAGFQELAELFRQTLVEE